jgi:hypothetical protein
MDSVNPQYRKECLNFSRLTSLPLISYVITGTQRESRETGQSNDCWVRGCPTSILAGIWFPPGWWSLASNPQDRLRGGKASSLGHYWCRLWTGQELQVFLGQYPADDHRRKLGR